MITDWYSFRWGSRIAYQLSLSSSKACVLSRGKCVSGILILSTTYTGKAENSNLQQPNGGKGVNSR